MATTKIWSIKDSIHRVIEYASNSEKTELNDLARAIHYAADGNKTEWLADEKVYLVSPINCAGDPYESMMKVREHFGDRGSILAFHAYQSFKPGECNKQSGQALTAEQCHKIGVELAQKLWGKQYQVMVATHMNCSHLHNHLILNPISIFDGKKIDSGYTNYYKLRDTSDELCRQYGLSVIKNPKGKTPRNIYFDEKAGKPTRYNLMRKAIDEAIKISPTWQDFIMHLSDRGYEFDRNENGKYPKIKQKNHTKWTRIYHLGEDYSLESIDKTIAANYWKGLPDYTSYVGKVKRNNFSYHPPRQHWLHAPEQNYGALLTLVLTFVYLLGGPDLITPNNPAPKYQPITPEMREATRRCEMYSRQAILMGKEDIHTKADADAFLERTERKLTELEQKRQQLRNSIRRCKNPEIKIHVQEKIHTLSAEMKPLRQQISDIKNVLERSGMMREMVKAEEKMRREKLEREYFLTQKEKAELKSTLPKSSETPTQNKKRERDRGR